MKKLIVWLVVLGLLGGGGAYAWQLYRARAKPDSSVYRTAQVRKADIVSSISATGTIVPEDVVDGDLADDAGVVDSDDGSAGCGSKREEHGEESGYRSHGFSDGRYIAAH